MSEVDRGVMSGVDGLGVLLGYEFSHRIDE